MNSVAVIRTNLAAAGRAALLIAYGAAHFGCAVDRDAPSSAGVEETRVASRVRAVEGAAEAGSIGADQSDLVADSADPYYYSEPDWDAPEGFARVTWRTLARFEHRPGGDLPADVRALDGRMVALCGETLFFGESESASDFVLLPLRFDELRGLWEDRSGDGLRANAFVRVRIAGKSPMAYQPGYVRLLGRFEVGEAFDEGRLTSVYRLVVDGVDSTDGMRTTKRPEGGRRWRIDPIPRIADGPATSRFPRLSFEPEWEAPEGFAKASWATLSGFEHRPGEELPPAIRALDGKWVAVCGYGLFMTSESESTRRFLLRSLELPFETLRWPNTPPTVNEVLEVRVVGTEPVRFQSGPLMLSGRLSVDEVVEDGEVVGLYQLEIEGPDALSTMGAAEVDADGRVSRLAPVAPMAPIAHRPRFGAGPPWYDEPEWSAPVGFEKVRWRTLAGFAYEESKGFAFDVWRLNYKRVALSGFIVPNDDGKDLREFRFVPERSTSNGASTTGEAKLNQFVLVRVPHGLAVDGVPERVVLSGRFFVGEERRDEQVTSVYRLELSGPEGVVRRK